MTLQVVLFLWHDPTGRRASVYGPADVARVARSIRRHITIPHEIVCITDYPAHEFPSDIRVIPLWDDFRHLGGCYTRLRSFAPDMAEIIGPRFVWLDIDTVVTGNLDRIFSRREDIVFWRSCTVASLPYNGSMVMMTAGARAGLLDAFDPEKTPKETRARNMVGTDQAALAYLLGPDEAVWTSERDGVCAFRRDCSRWLPHDARIVFFPGKTKPTNAKTRLQHPWIECYMEGQGPWPREEINVRVIRLSIRRTRRQILRSRAKAARSAAEEAVSCAAEGRG